MTALLKRHTRRSRVTRSISLSVVLIAILALFWAPSSAQAATKGLKFYVDPSSSAAQAVKSLRSSDPAEATELEKIADEPTAIWLGEWNTNQTTVVEEVLTASAAQSAVPVFVLYAIPDRDCGGYSSGGYSTDKQYEAFVNQIAAGVKGREAVFIVEPDALPMEGQCLDAAQQDDRQSLITYASKTLSVKNSFVYLDAGNYGWQSVTTMVPRLTDSGIKYARGFSVNVSSFYTTAQSEVFGNTLSAALDHKHYVVDTSRNGKGMGSTWCNPPGRALGAAPTQATNNVLIDAYLWIKAPGVSDGTCNGGPASGTWWTAYALGLIKN